MINKNFKNKGHFRSHRDKYYLTTHPRNVIVKTGNRYAYINENGEIEIFGKDQLEKKKNELRSILQES